MPHKLSNASAELLDTLAFFSCLVPARMYKSTPFSRCLPWFWPAGAAIGALGASASWAAFSLGRILGHAQSTCAMLAAFAYLAAEIILSRGLHWDGAADLADAVGSMKRGEAFRQVLKDSRIGTFGVLALLLLFLGGFCGAFAHAMKGNWMLLLLAQAWSRSIGALPLLLVEPFNKKSLGGQFASDRSPLPFLLPPLATALLAPLLGASMGGSLLLIALGGTLVRGVRSLAKRHGGISGDYVGASIEAASLLFLLCTL